MCTTWTPAQWAELGDAYGDGKTYKVTPFWNAEGQQAALIERLQRQPNERYQTTLAPNGYDLRTHTGRHGKADALDRLVTAGFTYTDNPKSEAVYTPSVPPAEEETLAQYQELAVGDYTLLQWLHVGVQNNGRSTEDAVLPSVAFERTSTYKSLRVTLLSLLAALSNHDMLKMFAIMTDSGPIRLMMYEAVLDANESEGELSSSLPDTAFGAPQAQAQEVVS